MKGRLEGEDIQVSDVAGIDDVEEGELSWIEGMKSLKEALKTPASAFIIGEAAFKKASDIIKLPCIVVKNPRLAFAQALECFYERFLLSNEITDTAVIGKDTLLGANVGVGDYSIIGQNCRIGNNVTIFPHVFIGNNVTIGDKVIVYPFASIHDGTIIGSSVILHSGCVIGADGFGFVEEEGVRYKIPQVGIVSLGNFVEIGANVTIDRATTGVTSVGDGTKIDNLIQIGHNNHIGKNCILVSQSGVAGSCEIGDNVTLAAQAGVAPHIKIGSNTVVGGRGGVTHDLPEDSIVSGFPAKPHKEALKLNGFLQRLPLMVKTIKELEKRLEELEEKVKADVKQQV